jgi:hypothetical protein
MARLRAPPARLTYHGGDFTGSPQELANALKPPPPLGPLAGRKRTDFSALKPAATPPQAGWASEAAPSLTAHDEPLEGAGYDLTASGRRVRRPAPKLAAEPHGASQPARKKMGRPKGSGLKGSKSTSRRKVAEPPALAQPSALSQARAPTAGGLMAAIAAAHGGGVPVPPPALRRVLTLGSQREDALLNALDMSLDDEFIAGLDNFCASI